MNDKKIAICIKLYSISIIININREHFVNILNIFQRYM